MFRDEGRDYAPPWATIVRGSNLARLMEKAAAGDGEAELALVRKMMRVGVNIGRPRGCGWSYEDRPSTFSVAWGGEAEKSLELLIVIRPKPLQKGRTRVRRCFADGKLVWHGTPQPEVVSESSWCGPEQEG